MPVRNDGLNILPVPGHIIMTVLIAFRTISIETVVKILLEIVPRKYALEINVQCVPLVDPEICSDAYIIVIHIFDSSHLLISASGIKDSVESSVDDIILIACIVAESPGCLRPDIGESNISRHEMIESIIGGNHTAQSLCRSLFRNNVDDSACTLGIIRSIRICNHLYAFDVGGRNCRKVCHCSRDTINKDEDITVASD